MTFDFGKIRVNVAWAEGVQEREGAEFIEYNVKASAPNVAPFKTNTWKQQPWSWAEERLMKEIAEAMMYTLAKAWSDPRGFISEEIKTARVLGKWSSNSLELVEKRAVETVQFTSALSPFMDDAIAALWKATRRDDQRWHRGPREWMPGRKQK